MATSRDKVPWWIAGVAVAMLLAVGGVASAYGSAIARLEEHLEHTDEEVQGIRVELKEGLREMRNYFREHAALLATLRAQLDAIRKR